MLFLLEIPHENRIILSQKGVQVNHMNPLCIRRCRSQSSIINREISLYRYVDIISFFSLYGVVIWDPFG